MLGYLLDTNYLLWSLGGSPQMSLLARDLLENTDRQIYFSQISLIEISIKVKLGKLHLSTVTLEDFYLEAIDKAKFTFLPITNQHIHHYQNIPLLEQHRDPFDRLLIATANIENLAIISADEKLKLYPEFIEVIS